MKVLKLGIVTVAISAIMATSAFAGTWKTGTGANQGKWWYDNGNGTYTSNGWQWIDGNEDGTAESYYFDGNGWLLTNTTTPDGYTVNGDGAWMQNGVIQTKAVSAAPAPISEKDFIVSGDNSVTRSNADNSIISNWVLTGYSSDPTPFHAFVKGDSLTTARGISFGSTKNDVMEKYGNAESQSFNGAVDKWYRLIPESPDSRTIGSSSSVIEYFKNPYGIRFYFDRQDQVIGILFFRDASAGNSGGNPEESGGMNPVNYKGDYSYSGGSSYILNQQTGNYELFASTSNASDEEWMNKIYPASFISEVKILDATPKSFQMDSDDSLYSFLQDGDKWICDINKDGVLQETEKNAEAYINLLEDGRIAAHDIQFINYENYYGWPMNSNLMTVTYYTRNK